MPMIIIVMINDMRNAHNTSTNDISSNSNSSSSSTTTTITTTATTNNHNYYSGRDPWPAVLEMSENYQYL